jgi:hypothetical protein
LEPTRQWLFGSWTSTYTPPSPADEHGICNQYCLSGWKKWPHYHQIENQHHVDSTPNHRQYLQGLTKEDHTWHHREVLLASYQLFGSGKWVVLAVSSTNLQWRKNNNRRRRKTMLDGFFNLIQCWYGRRETTMDTKNLILNQCWQTDKPTTQLELKNIVRSILNGVKKNDNNRC